ncbi:hypothetical protein UlMin_034683 [Ulmus minor]
MVIDTDGAREIALDFPAEDGGSEMASSPSSSSHVKLPRRLRRRLMVSKSPITAEDIEAKHRLARLRREQFHELLSSKARSNLSPWLVGDKNQRTDYLRHGRSSPDLDEANPKTTQEQDFPKKIVRCWRRFVRTRRTTFALAKAFEDLGISEGSVKSMSFEQLALQIESATTMKTTRALLNRLESRYFISRASTGSLSSVENIDHLLKQLASPIGNGNTKKKGDIGLSKKAAQSSAALPRYPVRAFLCAYMVLGHPDAVFSVRSECENALADSAAGFVREFGLLVKIILHGTIQTALEETDTSSSSCMNFRTQLEAFDKAWCSYLLHFVAWKHNDVKLLEEDLVRAACQLELSLMQTRKWTLEGDESGRTHDIKLLRENQKLLREKLQHLSGNLGLEHLESALSDIRSRYLTRKEPACSSTSQIAASVDHSVASISAETSKLTNSCEHSTQSMFDKDDSQLGGESSTSSSFKVVADDRLSPAALVIGENEIIVNEILHDNHQGFANILNNSDEDQNSLKAKVKETMEKAFWDGVMESMKKDNFDFSWILKLITEVRDELCDISPQTWKQEILGTIDIDILSEVLRSGNLDIDYFGRILEFSLVTLRKLSAPASDDDMKTTHNKFLKELGEVLQTEDKSKASCAIAITKGLRFVLQQIQTLKREISKVRLKIVEPLIKGQAGFEYLRKAFENRHRSPVYASTSLPITRQWLLSVKTIADEEWNEYIGSLSTVTSNERHYSGLPLTTTVRAGGSILRGTEISSQASSTTDTNAFSSQLKRLAECRGERVDLLVRLGLLKLVSEVGGLNLEILPETLELNLTRLRAVQSHLQKIIVNSTCLLVLRQTLLSENLLNNLLDMENIISQLGKQIANLLHTVEDVGIPELVDLILRFAQENDNVLHVEKLRERKQMMASMLGKSLQADDAVFKKVSQSVYVAARAAVLRGNGGERRELAEASLRRIGAASLTDDLVKAAEVVVVVSVVSCSVHRAWYEELIK